MCDDSWDYNVQGPDARVVCRQLGYFGGTPTGYQGGHSNSPDGTGRIWMTRYRKRQRLEDCDHS